jgi:hypothetical protein
MSQNARCVLALNNAYNKILEKHVIKSDIQNWNVEVDCSGSNGAVCAKFIENTKGIVCEGIEELISHNQVKKKRNSRKRQKYADDVRNTIQCRPAQQVRREQMLHSFLSHARIERS